MSTNEDTVRRWVAELVEGGNVEIVDELSNPDYVFHAPTAIGDLRRGAFETTVSQLYVMLVDRRMTVEDLIEADDRVAIRLSAEATIGGDRHRWSENVIYRLRDGRIAEEWTSELPPLPNPSAIP